MPMKTLRARLRPLKAQTELLIDRLRFSHFYRPNRQCSDPVIHIAEAAGWLKRAQDGSPDQGVSYGCRFGQGFLPSYPETTGYIIPTFLNLADWFNDKDYLERAGKMGQWEIDIQMECGAVMGGRVNPEPTPAVFNTGQVMLGWAALFERTQEEKFLNAGARAAKWLVSIQQEEGNWYQGNSAFADPNSTVYNVRAAWGLVRIGMLANEPSWIEAAKNNANFAQAQQNDQGWFANCCLVDAERPLLHTLAYTMRGLLEIGLLLGNQSYIESAKKTANSLMSKIDKGFLAGRFDPDFSPAVSWCCLTGSAQTSIVLSKLYRLTKQNHYREGAQALNQYLMDRHDINSHRDTIRGGIPGSWPVHGDYGRFMILNWATKFFIDLLLIQTEIDSPA